MTSRLITILAVALAVAALVGASIRLTGSSHPPARPVHASLPPSPASYLGVFEPGAPPSWNPVAEFAAAAGREPNLLGYYSGWLQPFDMSFAETIHQHDVIPFVQIDPTYASIAAIADGTYDDYLRTYADSVRDFGHNVVIGFGHEMNANWYSWGYGHTSPSTFVAAWRHIVTLFRAQGADNVTWVWTLQADEPCTGPIADQPCTGPIASWWPGAQYVSWVGVDGYYRRPTDTFASIFGSSKPLEAKMHMASFTMKDGRFVITLTDGEIWKQDDADEGISNWKRDPSFYVVNVYEGALGSYNMEVSDDSHLYKVHRLN